MTLLGQILTGVALVVAGAAFCYWVFWWRGRALARVKALEAEAALAKARTEAEIIIRDARLAANEEVRKLRDDADQALAARRAERSELEGRLAEREALINSQLSRIVEAEKAVNQQKEALRFGTEAVEQKQRELSDLLRRELEQLQKVGSL